MFPLEVFKRSTPPRGDYFVECSRKACWTKNFRRVSLIRSKTGFAKKIFLQLNICCLHSLRNLWNFPLSFSRKQPPRGRGRFSIALAVCMLMKDGDSILSDLLSESTAKALDRIEILQHPFKQRTKNNGSNIQDQKIRLRKQEEG